jgi:hypothetical protein
MVRVIFALLMTDRWFYTSPAIEVEWRQVTTGKSKTHVPNRHPSKRQKKNHSTRTIPMPQPCIYVQDHGFSFRNTADLNQSVTSTWT